MDNLTLSTFEKAHLAGALKLSRSVGWPHRLEDWAMLLSISKGVVAMEGENVLATALVTPMGPVATANMIIVDAARRGAGLGRRVVEAAMARIEPREWRLIATKDGFPLYDRMGFEAYGEIVQFQGLARSEPAEMPLPPLASMADLDALVALDRAATGMERRPLLAFLLTEGLIFVAREAGEIVAFAAQRHFGHGVVIGPVIARDIVEAQALMEPLIAASAGQFLRVDIDVDCSLAPWIAARGLSAVGGGVRMRKGPQSLPSGPQACFALAAHSLS